jgi:hypothetical protein
MHPPQLQDYGQCYDAPAAKVHPANGVGGVS